MVHTMDCATDERTTRDKRTGTAIRLNQEKTDRFMSECGFTGGSEKRCDVEESWRS